MTAEPSPANFRSMGHGVGPFVVSATSPPCGRLVDAAAAGAWSALAGAISSTGGRSLNPGDILRRRLPEGGPPDLVGAADELPLLVDLQWHLQLLGPAQEDKPHVKAVVPWVYREDLYLPDSNLARGVTIEDRRELPMKPEE